MICNSYVDGLDSYKEKEGLVLLSKVKSAPFPRFKSRCQLLSLSGGLPALSGRANILTGSVRTRLSARGRL